MSDQVKNIRFNFVIDTQPLQAANVAGTNLSATTTQLKTNLGQVGAAAQQAGTQASSAFNSAAVPLKNYNNVVNDIGINLRKIPSSAQAAGSARRVRRRAMFSSGDYLSRRSVRGCRWH